VDRLADPNVVSQVEAAVGAGSKGTADYPEISTSASYQGDNLVTSVTDGEGRGIDLAVPEASQQAFTRFAGARSAGEGAVGRLLSRHRAWLDFGHPVSDRGG